MASPHVYRARETRRTFSITYRSPPKDPIRDQYLMSHCNSVHIQVDNEAYDLKGNQTALQGYCQCPHSPFGLRLDCHTGTWYASLVHCQSLPTAYRLGSRRRS